MMITVPNYPDGESNHEVVDQDEDSYAFMIPSGGGYRKCMLKLWVKKVDCTVVDSVSVREPK